MDLSPEAIRSLDITAKWRDLNARRVAHLIELRDSGRWSRYYTAAEFALLMQEAVAVLEAWRQLCAVQEAAAPGSTESLVSTRPRLSLQAYSADLASPGPSLH